MPEPHTNRDDVERLVSLEVNVNHLVGQSAAMLTTLTTMNITLTELQKSEADRKAAHTYLEERVEKVEAKSGNNEAAIRAHQTLIDKALGGWKTLYILVSGGLVLFKILDLVDNYLRHKTP